MATSTSGRGGWSRNGFPDGLHCCNYREIENGLPFASLLGPPLPSPGRSGTGRRVGTFCSREREEEGKPCAGLKETRDRARASREMGETKRRQNGLLASFSSLAGRVVLVHRTTASTDEDTRSNATGVFTFQSHLHSPFGGLASFASRGAFCEPRRRGDMDKRSQSHQLTGSTKRKALMK